MTTPILTLTVFGKALLMPIRVLVPVGLTLCLAGCGAVGAIGLPLGGARGPVAPPPDFAIAAPTQPVQTADLPPLPGAANDPFAPGAVAGAVGPDQPLAGDVAAADPFAAQGGLSAGGLAGNQVALAAPGAGGGIAVGRTDLLGGWTINSGTEQCQLFMTLTTWSGGYRASTRGCTTPQLSTISAWNLEGTQVVLAGEGGAPVARLNASTENRFDGQIMASATPIAFFR